MTEAISPYDELAGQSFITQRWAEMRAAGSEGLSRPAVMGGVALGVVVLGTAAALLVRGALPGLPGWPDATAVPEESELLMRQLVLEERSNLCKSLGVWDLSTTSAQQSFFGLSPEVAGRVIVADRLKAVDETCLDTSKVTYRTEMKDGEPHRIVSVPQEAFRRDVKFREEDKQVTVIPGALNQQLGGLLEAATGTGRLGCIAAKGAINQLTGAKPDCNEINGLTQKYRIGDETYEKVFLSMAERQVREAGGKATWPETRDIFIDSVQEDAKELGFEADQVELEVLRDGKVSDQAPDFADPIEKELIDAGVLEAEIKNTKDLKFSEVKIIPLPSEADAKKQ